MSNQERGPIGKGFWKRLEKALKEQNEKEPEPSNDEDVLGFVCTEDDQTEPMDEGTEE